MENTKMEVKHIGDTEFTILKHNFEKAVSKIDNVSVIDEIVEKLIDLGFAENKISGDMVIYRYMTKTEKVIELVLWINHKYIRLKIDDKAYERFDIKDSAYDTLHSIIHYISRLNINEFENKKDKPTSKEIKIEDILRWVVFGITTAGSILFLIKYVPLG